MSTSRLLAGASTVWGTPMSVKRREMRLTIGGSSRDVPVSRSSGLAPIRGHREVDAAHHVVPVDPHVEGSHGGVRHGGIAELQIGAIDAPVLSTSLRAVKIAMDSGVAVVRLGDGPNAFDGEFVATLEAVLDEIEADPEARAVVTTGGGKHYSNGYDLEYLGSLAGDELGGFLDRSRRVLARVLTFPLPTAAALNGHAFGIGAMLALAHDRRVARRDRGWFCLPEIDLGMRFSPFMLALIVARLGERGAHEAILTGSRYDAAGALALGIAHAEADEAELVPTAAALLEPFTGKDRTMAAQLKRDLYASVLVGLDE
jgi:Delta3-Delta2-enoyl-CoA isomerase